ncbi:DUF2865 domain-containing protein [Alsobacter sp. SYSU M60028]|uniref:DUF2865 domain-containing protein n=1 Tax=Alsobacter ponti TaxID=2962936 RepID=A0ABT1LGQ3_9HYPH|nr:DUF2865 domain-containing protein [Alsobacter ponti]
MNARHCLAALAAAAGLAFAGAAAAQNASCDRLRADIAALDGAVSAGRNPSAGDNVRRQRAELDRTTAYARSIGCDRPRLIFFGEPRPAQCGQLDAQIAQMQSSLASLEAQAQRGGGGLEAQRAALTAAFEANCRGAAPVRPARGGLFEQLFGSGEDESGPGEDLPPPPPVGADFGDGSYRTLCVRKCDGYYFPISTSAPRGRFETDSALCQASCPAAEVELFVTPSGQSAEQAQSLTGEYYSSLPNAFRYRRAYDPSCGCRRPGQSWVEALSDADKLVSARPGDIVVTEQKSLEMSRAPEPAAPKPIPAKASAAKPPPAKPAAAPAKPAPPRQAATPAPATR